MKCKVEACWSGNSNFSFRITALGARWGRFSVVDQGGGWTRSVASEARDQVSRHFGVNRQTIRFVHH